MAGKITNVADLGEHGIFMNLIVMIFEVDDTKRSNPSPEKSSLAFGV